jgi:hypothetical protein
MHEYEEYIYIHIYTYSEGGEREGERELSAP